MVGRPCQNEGAPWNVQRRNATEGVPYRESVFSHILVEFLFRLSFGVATAMGLTSSRLVTSGFFRVHLWVLLGVQTLAALSLYSRQSSGGLPAGVASGQFWLAISAAVASYVGAVTWMYERPILGKLAIAVVAICSGAACLLPAIAVGVKPAAMQMADCLTSGLLLGSVTTAMLLGHWYLNTPTMKLQPLRRLIVLMGVAVGLRMAVCLVGLWLEATGHLAGTGLALQSWMLFVALRWLAGLFGVLVLAWLTWQTLRIPNTQSATGILYAGVILAFIGELTSQLLSAETKYPV
jgi:hypothetical protein